MKALAEQIAPTVLGRDQARRLDRLALEHDNFRAAFHWAIDRDETTIAMRLAAALWRYWQGRGHLEEGWATVSRILNDKPDVADATRKRVLRVMDEIGFAPQNAWRQIRSGRTGLIAVHRPEVFNPPAHRLVLAAALGVA